MNIPINYNLIFNTAKKNALRREIEWSLTKEDQNTIILRAKGHCEVTGIEFSKVVMGSGERRYPWNASVDRIDSMRGYSLNNTRLTCIVVNLAMNVWGAEVLFALLEKMGKRHTVLHLQDEATFEPAIRVRHRLRDAGIKITDSFLGKIMENGTLQSGLDYKTFPCGCVFLRGDIDEKLKDWIHRKGGD